MVKEKTHSSENKKLNREKIKSLILYNDDYNTFDFVIINLVKICGHDFYQAEQCALIAHIKGKCQIKHGKESYMFVLCNLLLQKGLTVEVI